MQYLLLAIKVLLCQNHHKQWSDSINMRIFDKLHVHVHVCTCTFMCFISNFEHTTKVISRTWPLINIQNTSQEHCEHQQDLAPKHVHVRTCSLWILIHLDTMTPKIFGSQREHHQRPYFVNINFIKPVPDHISWILISFNLFPNNIGNIANFSYLLIRRYYIYT
jgi:hypothetical protein